MYVGCTLAVLNGSSVPEGRGQVSSRGYPAPFADRALCERHVLVAPSNHLVKLTVTDLDLEPSQSGPGSMGCLSLFLHWPDGGDHFPPVTSYQRSGDVTVCHNSSVGRSWFSASRRLSLEFVSERNPEKRRGFSAEFKFVDRDQFVTRGQRLSGGGCHLLLLSEDRQSGSIFSEGFPALSPHRNCSYTLYGSREQRVTLTAVRVALQPADSSCASGDRLVVHGGTTERAQVIAEICRSGRVVQVTSSGPYLHVTSHVTAAPDGAGGHVRRPVAGFKLEYRFEEDPGRRDLPPDLIRKGIGQLSCHQMVLSGDTRSGEVSSPGHPLTYPANILCRCRGADSVTVLGLSAGRLRLLRRLCGSGQPARVMSPDHRLLLLFATGGATGAGPTGPTGFRATYRFVRDYGLTTGVQLPTSSCAFEFRSSMLREGTFRTPNAPGYYPGNTDCHFYFIGGANETVLVQFGYFDVEGIYPCRLGSSSDYLEVDSGDRSPVDGLDYQGAGHGPPERYCGDTAPPNPLIADTGHLRLTFHSNGQFEATGFEARYRFISRAEEVAVAPAASTGAAELRLPPTGLLLLSGCLIRLCGAPGPG
ncbi:Suppressor of lurcher protein 1 [Amphibalanus amphitrite]|uniref:Suppressor of lurcher protein 1 n=1 Tax=Amphibalanus amphitrite TaxID=1232801 RepID=A0A6A4WNX5_AMPAM|nr:Suppressor of lurcher protein 1 [Amphibalanus amphitrite]